MAMRYGNIVVTGLQVRDVRVLSGSTVPVDGETGRGSAGPGSLYCLAAPGNGAVYVNTQTADDPAWKRLAVEP